MSDTQVGKLKFSAPVDVLLEATSKVMAAVPSKSPKPALTNLKFSVKDGLLELSGTDFTSGIYYGLPTVTVQTPGTGLVNGDKFHNVLKEFRGVEATLTLDPSGGCRFKTVKGNMQVKGDDIRDYPPGPRFDEVAGVSIPGANLVEMIKKASFAAAEEETRLSINGILFEFKDGRLRVVATDNTRTVVTEMTGLLGEGEFSVSVPQAFASAVMKVTTRDVAAQTATIGVSDRKIFYKIGSATAYASVLGGAYPPYEEALDIQLAYSVDISVSELNTAIRRAVLVNTDVIGFFFEPDKLTLKGAAAAGAGIIETPVSIAFPAGVSKVKVYLNPSYVKEVLEVLTARKCRVGFEGPRSAVVLKEVVDVGGVESVSDRFVYAMMPTLPPEEDD